MLRVNPDSKSHRVEYFNSKSNQWIKGFGNITGVGRPTESIGGVKIRCIGDSPRDSPISLHSVDEHLYVGLQREKTFKNFVTHGPLSGWSPLPKMTTPFTGCTVAYLNRYLYTVGGYSTAVREPEFVYGCEVRRFNLDTKVWEDLPPIPSSPETTSVAPVVAPFMGKLFVYAAGKRGADKRSLFVFDPVHKTWKYHSKLNVSWLLYDDPRFVIEDGKLFRVLFEKSLSVEPENCIPNVAEFVLNKSATSIKLSNQQDQSSRVYVEGHDTFVIGESLFVNLKGYMHKLQISKDQWNPNFIRQRVRSLNNRSKNLNNWISPVFCKYTFNKVELNMGLPSK